MAIKNLWSLTIDEALVANEIKENFRKKRYEVFFPTNLQLKNIDLLLMDLEKMKLRTIQVKGSRTWNPSKSQRKHYGEGSSSWFAINKNTILNPSNRVDFFIFVLHNLIDKKIKKGIKINYLIIPEPKLKKIALKKLIRKDGKYHFYIWIDDKGKRAFDFEPKDKIFLSRFLDDKGWNILRK